MNVNIDDLLAKQDAFFDTHRTIDIDYRISQLKKLKKKIEEYEHELFSALHSDLGKSEFEAFTSEVGLSKKEIAFHIRNLKKWARAKRVSTPLFAFPSKSYIQKQPFGRVLIIGPFNFPFMLTIIPLIGAISAGNVVVIKPSEYTTKTSEAIERIISEVFDPEHVAFVQGGVETSTELLSKRWDKIFFTGSTRVGKVVMKAAAEHLTPVELELGGKNPVIVEKDAKLKVAAKRIIWGKFLNAGQSCVSPDYLYVHEDIKDEFLEHVKETVHQFFNGDPENSKDFGRLVNEGVVDRLTDLIRNENIFLGGQTTRENRYLAPTIITGVSEDSPIMQEEIFGPVLPVLTFRNLEDVYQVIGRREKPLVVYYFSENRTKQKEFLNRTFSGDASINETVIHFSNFSLPFGGVGYSGMGAYHGKHSFETFSHTRSVLRTPTIFDLPLRYPPAKGWVMKLLRVLFR